VINLLAKDGGPFVTLPIIHYRKNPNTNNRNVGMYRMQVFGPTLTGHALHKAIKYLPKHFNEYKKLNKIMPVAVALGVILCMLIQLQRSLPENVDEYMLGCFLRKKKVELVVKCITQPDVGSSCRCRF